MSDETSGRNACMENKFLIFSKSVLNKPKQK